MPVVRAAAEKLGAISSFHDYSGRAEAVYPEAEVLAIASAVGALRAGWLASRLAAAEVRAASVAGSGPAKGLVEISSAYPSSGAVRNFASPRMTDFVFDTKAGKFIMGRSPGGHDMLRRVGGLAERETLVGGQIARREGGLITNEWSGHYGQNWTPAIRSQFVNFMRERGIHTTHNPWQR